MSRERFRESIFAIIEYMTRTELRNSSKRLILNYYNTSTEPDAKGKALEAITWYLQANLSDYLKAGDSNLRKLIERMFAESVEWEHQ